MIWFISTLANKVEAYHIGKSPIQSLQQAMPDHIE